MNLDLLISKYLDGDLTPEEDKELRKIISEQPSARETFDISVAVHIAMREDAMTNFAPPDLLRRTEDKILMQILNQSNASAMYTDFNDPVKFLDKSLRRRVRSVVSALFLGVFWLGGAMSISDSYLKLPFSKAAGGQAVASTGTAEAAQSSHGSASSFGSRLRVLRSAARQGLATGTEEAGLAEAVIPDNMTAAASDFAMLDRQSDAPLVYSELRSHTAAAEESVSPALSSESQPAVSSLKTFSALKVLPAAPNTALAIGNGKDEIQMSTFFSNDVVRDKGKQDAAAISSVAQSISYGVSANDRIGIELGYSVYSSASGSNSNSDLEYFMFRSGRGASANYEYAQLAEGAKYRQMIAGAEPGTTPTPSPGNQSQSLNKSSGNRSLAGEQQVYWGAGFYERRLFDLAPVTVHARIGAGGSSEGGIGYGRLFGRYDVFSGISVTLGAESRTLLMKVPSGDSYDATTAVSLIYGVQVRF